MERRRFLEAALVLTGGTSFPRIDKIKDEQNLVRFGIVSDIHYANKEAQYNRYYKQSMEKLERCVEVMNSEEVDFLIELGDFKDMGTDVGETLSFLDAIEGVLKRFNGPSYHVLGNHDADNISKQQFLQRIRNTNSLTAENYYSFKTKDFQFIVLDANFSSDGTPYNKGNFDWRDCHIPEKQLNWLGDQLKNDYPTIIFIHQRLDSLYSLRDFCPDNSDTIRGLLEKSGNVLAVFQGHDHRGGFNKINDIPYYTLRGVIEGSGEENNSFAIVEIRKDSDNDFMIDIKGYYKAKSLLLNS